MGDIRADGLLNERVLAVLRSSEEFSDSDRDRHVALAMRALGDLRMLVHADGRAVCELSGGCPQRDLVERTREALNRGIKSVMPGRQINVIGRAIESYARRFGYGVVRDFTGHGVGESFHSGLVVPHYDAAPGFDREMEVGMVFTIEPMLTLGTIAWDQWDDGWTVLTKDRARTAQWEHTLVVTPDGAEILTLPSDVDLSPHL